MESIDIGIWWSLPLMLSGIDRDGGEVPGEPGGAGDHAGAKDHVPQEEGTHWRGMVAEGDDCAAVCLICFVFMDIRYRPDNNLSIRPDIYSDIRYLVGCLARYPAHGRISKSVLSFAMYLDDWISVDWISGQFDIRSSLLKRFTLRYAVYLLFTLYLILSHLHYFLLWQLNMFNY